MSDKMLSMGLKMSEDVTKAFGGILNSLDLTMTALSEMEAASSQAFDDTTIKAAREEIQNVRSNLIETNEEIGKVKKGQTEYKEETERSTRATRNLREELTQAATQAAALGIGAKSMRRVISEVEGGIDIFRGFQKQIDTVGAVIGATTEQMDSLNSLALKSSKYFVPEQIGAGMEELARRGWKYHDLLVGLDPVQNLAIGNTIEFGRAAEITSDTLDQFKLETDNAERIVNALSYSAANASTDVNLLGSSMTESASLARTFGMEFEELLAIISMEASSAKGSKAGRFVRTGLLDLANMSEQAKMTAQALGVEFIDPVTKDFKEIRTIIGDLNLAFEDLNNASKLQAAQNIFGTQGANAWLEIIDQGVEKFDEWMDGFENMGDFAYNQAQRMADNLDGIQREHLANQQIQWIEFFATLEELGIMGFVEGFYSALEELQGQVLIILEILATVAIVIDETFGGALSAMFEALSGPVITFIGLFGTLFAVTTLVGKGFTILWAIMNANPIIAIISLVVAIVTAIIRLWRTNDEFAIGWKKTWNKIREITDTVVNGIIKSINAVISALNKLPGVDISALDEIDVDANTKKRAEELQNFINKRKSAKDEEDLTKDLIKDIDFVMPETDLKGLGSSLDGIGDIGKANNKELKGIKNSVDVSNEDIKLLRDIAEDRVINRFTTQTISPEISVEFNGTVDGDIDIDGIVTELTDKFIESLETSPEGVYG